MVKLNRVLSGIFIFYRGFWIPATLMTVFCCIGAFSACVTQLRGQKEFYGILMFVSPFVWIKAITDTMILLYLIQYKAREMYFYFNLGIGTATLCVTTLIIDFLVFTTAIYLTGLSLDLFILPAR